MDIGLQPDWGLTALFLAHLLAVIVVVEALTEFAVESEPLEDLRQWLGRKSTLIGLGVTCGKCFSFWVAMAAGGLMAWQWWPRVGPLALVFPFAGWRLSGLYHDALSWFAAKKEELLESPVLRQRR